MTRLFQAACEDLYHTLRRLRIRLPGLVFSATIILLCMSMGPMVCQAYPKLTNSEITDAVSDILMKDPGVSSYWIDISTNEGIVTLSGTTHNILAKDRAVKLAQTVKGVRSVIDRIAVSPPPRRDMEIQEDVQDALLVDPATDSWEISSMVNDGVVTLMGTVDSWHEKQLAAKVAKGVSGVKELKNNIRIDYEVDRPDSEIEAEVEQLLHWDALVDDALINVNVNSDRVRLTGTVGSAAEKSQAIGDAWVTGVDSVDARGLKVESWARDDRFRKDKYVQKSDDQVADAVKDALVYDPRVLSTRVDVSADSGMVTLTGQVDNLRARRAADATARNTVGVWSVVNQIIVRPSTSSDKKIENNLEQALSKDPLVNRHEMTVNVVDKEAYLFGTVDTYFEKAEAEDIAESIYGMVEVHNNLDVEKEYDPWFYDPYLDDLYPYDYDWYVHPDYTPSESDWEIKEEIESELFWSPFVDEQEVTVKVDDGLATLTGTVDTWNERNSAEQQAYEGGAVAVDNDLLVEYGPDYYEP